MISLPFVVNHEGMFCRSLALVLLVSTLAACRLKDTNEGPMMIPAPPDVAAAPSDASVTASGLASKVLQPGNSNVRPSSESTVRVHYTGWTTDGEMFDSSLVRGQPVEFPLNGVIPGWTEGVQLMVVGEKRRFWIPAELAYNNAPGTPQGTLVFDVELLGVIARP